MKKKKKHTWPKFCISSSVAINQSLWKLSKFRWNEVTERSKDRCLIFQTKICEPQPSIRKSRKVCQDWKTLSIFAYLLSASAKIYFWKGDWTLSCVPMQFWDFAIISVFPKILSLNLFSNSSGNLYILETKFLFIVVNGTCTKTL